MHLTQFMQLMRFMQFMQRRVRNRTPCVARSRWSRAGFTLIEVLVAVMLIDVGLLALAASSAVLVRQTTQARARIAALQAASNRLETLAAAPCVAGAGIVVAASGLREYWSADSIAVSTRE